MKKLLTLAVALGAAALTHAASFNWKVNGESETVNYQVYIVGSIVTTWTSVSDIATAASTFGSATSGTITKQSSRNISANGTASIESISKDSASVYFVIVSGDDAKTYNYANYDVKGSVYSGTDASPGTFTIEASDLSSSGSFAGSIPEPTSGLLMLVGLAGLALRRKRA